MSAEQRKAYGWMDRRIDAVSREPVGLRERQRERETVNPQPTSTNCVLCPFLLWSSLLMDKAVWHPEMWKRYKTREDLLLPLMFFSNTTEFYISKAHIPHISGTYLLFIPLWKTAYDVSKGWQFYNLFLAILNSYLCCCSFRIKAGPLRFFI